MKKILTFVVLPLAIIALAYAIVASVQEPVKFEKEKSAREKVAVQRLKDIRTLQVAFKSKYGRYAPTMDSLAWFYNEDVIVVSMQIGSADDSLAVATTKALKKKNPKITGEQMMKMYEAGEKNLVFSIDQEIRVKDTLLKRPDFVMDSIGIIPFSGGRAVAMKAVIKKVSGVDVPLFEAGMPYEYLLSGMNHQLLVNLWHERTNQSRYPGLKVGSVDNPNNNAGNWE